MTQATGFQCFPRILRRILSSCGEEKDEVAPGIVARLMGLESVPADDGQKSRSMKKCGFLDYQELQEDEHFFILSFERKSDSSCRRLCRRKEIPKFDLHHESENSSPNSVLEFNQFTSEDRNSAEITSVSDDYELRRAPSENLEKRDWVKRRRKARERFLGKTDEISGNQVVNSIWISPGNVAEVGVGLTTAILDLLVDELLISLLFQ